MMAATDYNGGTPSWTNPNWLSGDAVVIPAAIEPVVLAL